MFALGLPLLIIVSTYIGLFSLGYHLKKTHDKNPDATTIESGLTPLMLAAANGDLARIEQLIKEGADPDSIDESRCTALMFAARNNKIEIIKYLIQIGADKKIKTRKGNTAHWFAKNNGHSEAASLLDRN